MFNRANKMTALLVAAAAVVSLVPATGVNATTRLGSKDGTVETAVAFKDGKYIYEGYRSDDDDKAIYYNNGGDKDKQLENIEDATLHGAYGDKYAFLTDGSDEYLVDLSNGKVIDDDILAGDMRDTTETKLRNKLEKTNRYGDAVEVTLPNTDDDDKLGITPNQFGEVWYSYKAEIKDSDADGMDNAVNTNHLYGFVSDSGKYIDASNLANVYAFSTAKKKVVKVDEFNDVDKDVKLEVKLNKQPEVLAQDKDYIYAKVDVKITDECLDENVEESNSVATIDLNKAKFEMLDEVKEATKEVYEFTLQDGKKLKVDGKDVEVDIAKADTVIDTLNKLDGYTAKLKGGNKVIVEAKEAGKVAKAVIEDSEGLGEYSRTEGKDQVITPNKVAPIFKVGDQEFKFNEAARPEKGDEYKDETDLRNKVMAKFIITPQDGYVFDAATLTFTASTNKTEADVKNDLKENVTVKEGNNASTHKKFRNATYIQKISKAQGEKKDGAFLPKSVASYEISSDYDCGDADDAQEILDKSGIKYNVIDEVLYATEYNNGNVSVTTIKLKKDKVEFDNAPISGFDSKVDVYLAEKDEDDDQDIDDIDACSIDVNGNTWAIDNGKIYKFVKGEFKEMYTCDKSFNKLNVYDDGSLVAWNEDKDSYTTLQEGKKVTEDEATEIVTPAKQAGWEKQADGTWVLYDTTGNMVKGWAPVGGQWYYMNDDGKMATGWKEVNGTWYFLNGSGAMQTGWYSDNGTWYYLNASGAMQTGWTNVAGNWYKLNQSGQMQTGWIEDNGTWYFCEGSGKMLANTTVNGYVLGANGAWIR
ncbi:hypothetical protein [Clostridium sp. ZBS15]|uniref:hypothetical protein n=1 Tax=Clostridium sp. ZBS15 TaxID=2949969 RepID=UPI00207AC0BE|nr:hypothetical protein [Clostridium sp. ZBS15]